MPKTAFEKLKSIKNMGQDSLTELMENCRQEAHEFFDQNIRALPKNDNGDFTNSKEHFYDNDVDAFRHAYTSGVYTQEYWASFADILGVANEVFGNNTVEVQNMDLWNNSVGRKYGNLTDSRLTLVEYIKKALENGELIVDPEDGRIYEGLKHFNYDPDKPVKVIEEQDTGLNEYFLDQSNGNVMHRDEFIAQINSGNYPGYKVVFSGGVSFPMSIADGDARNNLG